MRRDLALTLSALLGLSTLAACGEDEKKPAADKKPAAGKDAGKASAAAAEYAPKQDALEGDAKPALLLSQAWFMTDAAGKPKPGPARIQVWRQGAAGWESSLLEDGESNVFHKTIITGDRELVTIGAEGAHLKRWRYADGKWSSETLWSQSWGGKFNRLRDIEIGDVDGDGQDEWVIATHDAGVVAVAELDGDKVTVTEMDQKADTFVHEIEIGDIDGDGKLEFFATPSDRNKANASQPGLIVMYKHDGEKYVRTTVDGGEHTHAKEILATDLDGDGTSEFMSVLEAETGPNKEITSPVKIRLYTPDGKGGFTHEDIATIDDRQTRFVLAEDFDGDGRKEIVAAAMKTGLYFIDATVEGKGKGAKVTWSMSKFDAASSGFEHAMVAHDMDGDGTPELYVAADDQRELKQYTWSADKKTFDKKLLGRLNDKTITWNVVGGTL
jgi:hypothetical protein